MRKNVFLIILCITGILLNRFCRQSSEALGIPLYLDTIMTIAVTLLAGPLCGLLTGAFTNILSHTIDNSGDAAAYLFALCNMAVALITWFSVCLFSRELNLHKKSEIHIIKTIHAGDRFNIIMDHVIVLIILSCIPVNIIDRLVSVFTGYGIAVLLKKITILYEGHKK